MLPSNDRNITHVITWKHLKHGQGVEYRYSYTMTYCFSPRIGFDNWFWDEQEFHPTYLVGQELEVVKSPKCLAFIVTSNFTWNAHVNNVVANTMKRLFPCTGKALSQKNWFSFNYFTLYQRYLSLRNTRLFLSSAKLRTCNVNWSVARKRHSQLALV